jgi:predicted nicotinamide N-methyase
LAVRIANPFATLAYNPTIDARILLLWPDRIELRPIRDLASFSPLRANAGYSFVLPAERQTWVTEQLKTYSTPTNGTSWRLRVKPLESGSQEIDLELLGDGIYGVVYEASKEKVVPLKTRLAGPGFAFIVFGIDVLGSVLLLLVILLFRRLLRLRRDRMRRVARTLNGK